MKADDYRSLTSEELDAKVADLRKHLFNLKMQVQSNQLSNSNQIRDTKKDIARVLTVQKELAAQTAGE
jgi:large subunit ribosomal protein L29